MVPFMKINYSEITSATNPKIKAIKKLEQKRQRDREGLFVIEGFHLVEEAIQHRAEIEMILHTDTADQTQLTGIESLLQQNAAELPSSIEIITITDSILTTLSQTPAPQGILAILKQPTQKLEEILEAEVEGKAATNRPLSHLLLLDNVQDPGNVGTMIRTAEAAGFRAIILGEGSADLYNDKTIRATQGALFQLPIIRGNLEELLPKIHNAGYESWVTTLEEATFYHKLEKPAKCALIMGNEGQGVDPKLQNIATTKVKIPMLGQSESLNVGIAAGILIYDLMPK